MFRTLKWIRFSYRSACTLRTREKWHLAAIFAFVCVSCIYFVRMNGLDTIRAFMEFEPYPIVGSNKSHCCRRSQDVDICGRRNCIRCQDPNDPIGANRSSLNVFFHETSQKSLNWRQACAVESTALHNPDLNVYVIMTGQMSNGNIQKILEHYSNVLIRQIDLSDYLINTPLEQWYFCTNWNYGWYATSHLSDALRFLTLSKYGGYYFDLDFVMVRNVSHLRNFLAPESRKNLAAGALHVEPGHQLISMAVDEFKNTYRRNDWGFNGPQLLTRIMKRWCQVENVTQMNEKVCHHVTVVPRNYFYPVHFRQWGQLFDLHNRIVPDWNETIGVHVWNQFSRQSPVFKGSDQIYSQLARIHCPLVYADAGDVF